MIQYTENNHFHWTYDNVPFALRKNPYSTFKMHWGRPSRPVGNFKDESLNVCRMLADKYPGQNFNVFFSGGIDSELVLQAFLWAGLRERTKATIIRFKDGYNDHDIKYAIDFCNYHNVPYKILEIDIVEFYRSKEYIPIGMKYQSIQLAQIQCLWALDKIQDDIPVLGTGEVFFEKIFNWNSWMSDEPKKEYNWVYYVRENNDLSVPKYSVLNQRPVISEFFSYTPEIMKAYVDDSIVRDLLADRLPGKLSIASSKYSIYNKYFFLKPRKKYHGYETLKLLNVQAQQEMLQYIPYNDHRFEMLATDFIKTLE